MRISRPLVFRSRATLLVGWLLLILLFGPVVPGPLGRTLVAISLAVIPFFGVYAVSQNRRYVIIGIVLGLPVIVTVGAWVIGASRSDTTVLSSPMMASFIAYYGATTIMIVKGLFRQRQVTFDTLTGAAAVYLLAGFTFAIAYTAIFAWNPGSFNLPAGSTTFDLASSIYFSFVTLTTLGYGDILPTHAMARSLVMIEAICGVLYLAIIISRMVSLYHENEASDDAS